jgi:parallel beta-helix repeat protein
MGEGDNVPNKNFNYFLGIMPATRQLIIDFEEANGQNHPLKGTTPVPDGQWVLATATYDGALRLYLNGCLEAELTANQLPTYFSIQSAAIGGALKSDGTRDGAFDGLIDEARIANTARSSNWVHTCWFSMASNATFNSYGIVEHGALPFVQSDPPTDFSNEVASFHGTILSTGETATAAWFYWGTSDGGTNPAAWDQVKTVGMVSTGAFSAVVTGLVNQVEYVYRCAASNAAGRVWSRDAQWFTAGPRRILTVKGEPDSFGASSPYGYGSNEIVRLTVVTNTVSGFGEIPGQTRYAPNGWTGTGSVPASGTSNTVVFTITTNSTLTWRWIPSDYYLDLTAETGGSVDTPDSWVATGTVATVTAIPPIKYAFQAWQGDVPATQTNENPLHLLMDQPRSVTATFTQMNNIVNGTLSSNTVWTADASPYLVDGDLTIPVGVILTIEPGVEVQILRYKRIRVFGTILATGSTSRPVRFCNHPAQSSGGYIKFYGNTYQANSTGLFSRCEIDSLAGTLAAFEAEDATIDILNCGISNILRKATLLTQCRVQVLSNTLYRTGEGVNMKYCAGTLSYNRVSDVQGDADALDLDYTWGGPGDNRMILEWNDLEGAQNSNADAIDLSYCTPIIRNNYMRDFADKGISLGPNAHPFVYDNLIEHCRVGIQIKDSSNPRIVNNTIVNCSDYGINSYEKGQGSGGPGLGSMTNTIIWNCPTNIYLEDGSTLSVGYCLTAGDVPYPGPGNIAGDPHFVNAASNDYRLQDISIAIDNGIVQNWMTNAVDMAGSNRVFNSGVDIGAFEYPDRTIRLRDIQIGTPRGGIVFSWQSVSNAFYSVETTTNLQGGSNWSLIDSNIPAMPPLNTYRSTLPAAPVFYRVIWE